MRCPLAGGSFLCLLLIGILLNLSKEGDKDLLEEEERGTASLIVIDLLPPEELKSTTSMTRGSVSSGGTMILTTAPLPPCFVLM